MSRFGRTAAVLFHALAGGALAAEGAHHAPSIADLLLPTINFVLFVFMLYWFVWPMVKTAVADRRRLVETEIAESKRTEDGARTELAAIERLRATQEEEGERILRELRAEGEAERAAIVEAARRTAERMREDARRLGVQEASRAAHEIRRAVAGEAVLRAEAVLRERIGDPEQRRFLADFVAGVAPEAPR